MTQPFRYSAGERGRNRVRVFAHWRTKVIYAEFTEEGRRVRVSLGHDDPVRAKQYADTLSARIGAREDVAAPLSIAALFDIYLTTVTPTKGPCKRSHDKTVLKQFAALVGESLPAVRIVEDHGRQFIASRREEGRWRARPDRPFRPLSDRTIGYDLSAVKAALAWAVRTGRLPKHPLLELTVPNTGEIKRPVLTAEEYQVLLTAAPKVAPGCQALLVMVWETGHRIGAVRQLRWEDVDVEAGVVIWRTRFDKMRKSHRTPLSPAAVTALKQWRAQVGVLGPGWIFASPKIPGKQMSASLARDYWAKLEQESGIPRMEGRGWHSIRRTFSMELRHLPLKDAMQLGGWRDVKTFVETYQPLDLDQLKVSLAARRKA